MRSSEVIVHSEESRCGLVIRSIGVQDQEEDCPLRWKDMYIVFILTS